MVALIRTTMMKTIAVYLGNEPYPKQGGMERVTDILIRILAKRYNVLVVCKAKNRLGEIYQCPAPIYFLPATKDEQKREFLAILKENRVDVLIDQVEGAVIGRYGIFRHRSELNHLALKCIAVQHSSAMSILKNYHIVKRRDDLACGIKQLYNGLALPVLKKRAYRLQQALSRDLNTNYDKIVTLSASFIPHFYEFAPATPKDKVISISDPNTYEDEASRSKQEKIVLSVGRLDNKVKGVDRLLRIWSMIEKEQPEWKLKIVGDGQDKAMLMELSRKLCLSRVSFEGFRVPKPYYEEASIFCMTSTFEGFGMVLTEAMQHGVVPIAFNSYEALKDIVTDGTNGCIIPAFDEALYARKLQYLMEHPDVLNNLSEQAITGSERFSRERIAHEWYKLIESL